MTQHANIEGRVRIRRVPREQVRGRRTAARDLGGRTTPREFAVVVAGRQWCSRIRWRVYALAVEDVHSSTLAAESWADGPPSRQWRLSSSTSEVVCWKLNCGCHVVIEVIADALVVVVAAAMAGVEEEVRLCIRARVLLLPLVASEGFLLPLGGSSSQLSARRCSSRRPTQNPVAKLLQARRRRVMRRQGGSAVGAGACDPGLRAAAELFARATLGSGGETVATGDGGGGGGGDGAQQAYHAAPRRPRARRRALRVGAAGGALGVPLRGRRLEVAGVQRRTRRGDVDEPGQRDHRTASRGRPCARRRREHPSEHRQWD